MKTENKTIPPELLDKMMKAVIEDQKAQQGSFFTNFMRGEPFETRRDEGFSVPAKTELISPDGEVLMRDGELVEKEMKVSFKHTIRFR